MHITDRARAVNIVGAWALAVADTIHHVTESAAGMSGATAAGLAAAAAEPGITIDELRHALGLTHPGAVRLVDRLQDRGLIERRPGHGRSIMLFPTASGRRLHRRLLRERRTAIEHMTRHLGDDLLDQLAALVSADLGDAATDRNALRRLCRLCDRNACAACPAAAGTAAHDSSQTS